MKFVGSEDEVGFFFWGGLFSVGVSSNWIIFGPILRLAKFEEWSI